MDISHIIKKNYVINAINNNINYKKKRDKHYVVISHFIKKNYVVNAIVNKKIIKYK